MAARQTLSPPGWFRWARCFIDAVTPASAGCELMADHAPHVPSCSHDVAQHRGQNVAWMRPWSPQTEKPLHALFCGS